MQFKFEKLIIWHKAIDYGERIFRLSYKFPKEEMYNLSSPIRRAVDNIALNISEGAIRQANPEFKEHYEYALNLMNMMVAFKEKIK